MTQNLDAMYRKIRESCPNVAVSWYLSSSFLYYHCDDAVISDALFDEICADLLARFDELAHPHRHLLDRAALGAGTGFALKVADYPPMVRGAARVLLRGAPFFRDIPAWMAAIDPVEPPAPAVDLVAPEPPLPRPAAAQLSLF